MKTKNNSNNGYLHIEICDLCFVVRTHWKTQHTECRLSNVMSAIAMHRRQSKTNGISERASDAHWGLEFSLVLFPCGRRMQFMSGYRYMIHELRLMRHLRHVRATFHDFYYFRWLTPVSKSQHELVSMCMSSAVCVCRARHDRTICETLSIKFPVVNEPTETTHKLNEPAKRLQNHTGNECLNGRVRHFQHRSSQLFFTNFIICFAGLLFNYVWVWNVWFVEFAFRCSHWKNALDPCVELAPRRSSHK